MAESSSEQLVEEEIKGGDAAVTGNQEIGSAIGRRLTWDARYPLDASAIAQFLGLGDWLILEVRMSSSERPGDAIDLVVATINALVGIVEHAILVPELFEGDTPAQGVAFPEDIGKIAEQQA